METYLNTYRKLIEEHIAEVRNLLVAPTMRQICWEWHQQQNFRPDNRLNVFTIASDLYYRENFHSDIIKFFLDPNEKHNEGTAFLYAFIDFLNSSFNKKLSIIKSNYKDVFVEREQERIDILVGSNESKHCIILENKINNAPDMQRQLPRYYDVMKSRGFTIDAMVYLPLDVHKRPDMATWSEKDKQNVEPVLCLVPAFQKNCISLVDGWLRPCTQLTSNIDCISVLRQYSELITLLSNNNMDNVILGKFYESLLEEDNLQSALSIRNMLNDIPVYMKNRIMGKLGEKGVENIWSWRGDPRHCGVIYTVNDGKEYKIDIWSPKTEDLGHGYDVCIFGQGMPLSDVPWSKEMEISLKELGYAIGNETYWKNYRFNEDELVNEVAQLAQQMKGMLE